MTGRRLQESYGRAARNRLDEAIEPGLPGALAALESFYHAFNNADLAVLETVWAPDALVRLNNPLGGILEGRAAIVALYRDIFEGPASVWVEFHDVVAYPSADCVVFAGRERGEFVREDVTVPLDIRTSRFLHRRSGRWGQVHHHGSISDTDLLARYRGAVRP